MKMFYIFDIFLKMSHFFLLKIAVPNSVTGKKQINGECKNLNTVRQKSWRHNTPNGQWVWSLYKSKIKNVLGYITSYQIFIFWKRDKFDW